MVRDRETGGPCRRLAPEGVLIHLGESDPAARLDCEQAADAALINLEDCGQG
jgi:hypothetical protein